MSSLTLNQTNFLTRDSTACLVDRASDLIKSKVKDGSTLFDMGTGDGAATIENFIEKTGIKFSKVIGSDYDTEHVKFANGKYGSPSIHFEIYDATKEVPNRIKVLAPFDIVTAFHMYHLLTNEEVFQSVKNVKKVLKKGGVFYFTLILELCPTDLKEKLLAKYSLDQVSPIFDFFDPTFQKDDKFASELKACLIKEGFDLDSYEHHAITYVYKSDAQMRGN